MAGLDRKVLNSRRITKIMVPSNPVFSRSFITSFGVASYRQGVEHVPQCRVPLLDVIVIVDKKCSPVWSIERNGVHLHRKTKRYNDNEGLFI